MTNYMKKKLKEFIEDKTSVFDPIIYAYINNIMNKYGDEYTDMQYNKLFDVLNSGLIDLDLNENTLEEVYDTLELIKNK